MVTTSYAEKVNALLAKASATDHDAERETFTEAAERLMVKWGVSDAMLADADQHKKKRGAAIESRRYHVPGTSGALLAELVAQRAARGVAPVRCLYAHGHPTWWAIGYPDDLARVELYVPHIVAQARAAWKRHLRAARGRYYGRGDYAAARVAFLSAFGLTVWGRLSDMFAAETEATGGAALVLASREDDVEAFMADQYAHVKIRQDRQADHYAASVAGVRAGNEATLAAGVLS